MPPPPKNNTLLPLHPWAAKSRRWQDAGLALLRGPPGSKLSQAMHACPCPGTFPCCCAVGL